MLTLAPYLVFIVLGSMPPYLPSVATMEEVEYKVPKRHYSAVPGLSTGWFVVSPGE